VPQSEAKYTIDRKLRMIIRCLMVT